MIQQQEQMPYSQRVLLQSLNPPPPQLSVTEPPQTVVVDSDVVVILASLLCALICVVGLALVARCAWLTRYTARTSPPPPASPAALASSAAAAAAKGLKRKTISSLPTTVFELHSPSSRADDCPICLAEFCEGEELRVLPQCGHRYHVGCVDTWLAAHSSCPSCRQLLLDVGAATCDRCGGAAAKPGGGIIAMVTASQLAS